MEVNFTLNPNIFNEEVLLDIYKIFCDSYETDVSDRVIRDLKRSGLDEIVSSIGIDQRPCSGGKFFGKQTKDKFRFHGYSIPPNEDPRYEEKSLKFERKLNEYISALKQNA